jgi:titin
VPSSPVLLDVSAVTTTYIGLEWREPTDTGGAAVLGYSVDRAAQADGEPPEEAWEEVAELVGSRTTHSSAGLLAETRYCFRVKARNNVGAGRPTNGTCAVTELPEPPQPVTVVFPSVAGADSVTVSWAAGNGSGLPVQAYSLEACTGLAGACADFAEIYAGSELARPQARAPCELFMASRGLIHRACCAVARRRGAARRHLA